MKKYHSLAVTILVLASCSSPKYTYNFDYYDYNSGKKKATSQDGIVDKQSTEKFTMALNEKSFVASTNENEVYVSEPAPTISREEAVMKIKSMTREERRELKKEVKNYVKESKNSTIKSEQAAKAMTGDVKMAAIFGAIGIVLLIIGGDVLYLLGAVALLIGLYFLIRYLSKQ